MTPNPTEPVCLRVLLLVALSPVGPPTGAAERGGDEHLAGGPVPRALRPAEEVDGAGGGGGGPGGPAPLQGGPLAPPAGER